MSLDSSNQLGSWDCAKDALAELLAFPSELKTFIGGLFDQMGELNRELLVQELENQRKEHYAERDAMRTQIDRLAAIVADLTGALGEPANTY
jgi:hypothetical protein